MVQDESADSVIYLDSSALAKLFVPEPESEELEAFLLGRRDLSISDLALTEVVSAVTRKRREGKFDMPQAFKIRDAVLAKATSGSFRLLELSPFVHRQAEQLLLQADSVSLRTLDALHVALALHGSASHVVTFDLRMRLAALHAGLKVVEF